MEKGKAAMALWRELGLRPGQGAGGGKGGGLGIQGFRDWGFRDLGLGNQGLGSRV